MNSAGIAAAFEARFGRAPAVVSRASGRVNLIGEHTDYNGGFVLPVGLPQETVAAAAAREDAVVRAWSVELSPGSRPEEFALGGEAPAGAWIDYVQGVTTALRAAGHAHGGVDLLVHSTVPIGSGLSSSAALEVAVLRALRDLFGLDLDDVALARLGQAAENDFVGTPTGIMDQMAASVGGPGTALFLDTRSMAWEPVPLPASCAFIVVNSGVTHSHAGGDYATRRAECERAAALLGVPLLRDVGPDDLARIMALPEPLGRRARHVVTENARVLEAVEALRRGDAERLGRLFSASHASQRDDYEVSVPEVDLLVSLAEAEDAVLGARLTGGGFGGSIVALVRPGEAAAVAPRVAAAYTAASGRTATVLVP